MVELVVPQRPPLQSSRQLLLEVHEVVKHRRVDVPPAEHRKAVARLRTDQLVHDVIVAQAASGQQVPRDCDSVLSQRSGVIVVPLLRVAQLWLPSGPLWRLVNWTEVRHQFGQNRPICWPKACRFFAAKGLIQPQIGRIRLKSGQFWSMSARPLGASPADQTPAKLWTPIIDKQIWDNLGRVRSNLGRKRPIWDRSAPKWANSDRF